MTFLVQNFQSGKLVIVGYDTRWDKTYGAKCARCSVRIAIPHCVYRRDAIVKLREIGWKNTKSYMCKSCFERRRGMNEEENLDVDVYYGGSKVNTIKVGKKSIVGQIISGNIAQGLSKVKEMVEEIKAIQEEKGGEG